MFASLQALGQKLAQKIRGDQTEERTVENSGLAKTQIETGMKTLKILGIEPDMGLTKMDVVIFLYAVGLNPTDDLIDSKLRSLKLHENQLLNFGQTCHVWHSMLQDLTDEAEILRRAFQFFDKDGNGEISVQELRTTMHELGDLLTEEEIVAFMEVMDVNNDGVIGFEEFISTLKTQAPDISMLDHVDLNELRTAASETAHNTHVTIPVEGLGHHSHHHGEAGEQHGEQHGAAAGREGAEQAAGHGAAGPAGHEGEAPAGRTSGSGRGGGAAGAAGGPVAEGLEVGSRAGPASPPSPLGAVGAELPSSSPLESPLASPSEGFKPLRSPSKLTLSDMEDAQEAAAAGAAGAAGRVAGAGAGGGSGGKAQEEAVVGRQVAHTE